MLVLMRHAGESILIGPDIKVVVTSIELGRVYLGIEAPRQVAILRDDAVKQTKGTLR